MPGVEAVTVLPLHGLQSHLDRLSEPPEVYVTLTAMACWGLDSVEVVNTRLLCLRLSGLNNFSEIISWFLL